MSLVSQCRQLREARGKTLTDIGRVLGMATQNLSAILLGKKDSRASTLEALAAALDAQWVLVPNERIQEVRQVLEGKGSGPDRSARGALDIFLDKE
ncbi:helix-turn-helix domain-containing protein [Cupriavidus necator]|uniref:helix-turn-helix domain-containing protein n=1 Tax=Cupriavidus necator TaxID=106590 RepID=UPI0019D2275B|nr:helix-turn-helix domain-containing protein [Cupriavidus necator]